MNDKARALVGPTGRRDSLTFGRDPGEDRCAWQPQHRGFDTVPEHSSWRPDGGCGNPCARAPQGEQCVEKP